jgi:carbonic anhydrase/acetyltransferase-like protein (isoleucine patch superfamily)
VLGAGCIVRAGAVVKQRSQFPAGSEIDGFPARGVGTVDALPALPVWAFRDDDDFGQLP